MAATIEQLSETVRNLSTRLKEQEERVIRAEETASNAEQELNAFRDEMMDHMECHPSLKDAETRIAQLEQTVVVLSSKVETKPEQYSLRIREVERTMNAQTKKIASMLTRTAKIEKKAYAAAQGTGRVTSTLDTQQEQIAALQDDSKTFRNKLDAIDDEVEKITTGVKTGQGMAEALQQDVASLMESFQHVAAVANSAHDRLSRLQAEWNLESINDKTDVLASQVTTVMAKMDEVESRVIGAGDYSSKTYVPLDSPPYRLLARVSQMTAYECIDKALRRLKARGGRGETPPGSLSSHAQELWRQQFANRKTHKVDWDFDIDPQLIKAAVDNVPPGLCRDGDIELLRQCFEFLTGQKW